MSNNLKLYFSMITGDMFYIEADEVKNLDKQHIPLKSKPKPSCNKCYGRFYEAYEVTKKFYIPCRKCMKKYADWDAVKGDEITIERPKTTSEIADREFIEAITKTKT